MAQTTLATSSRNAVVEISTDGSTMMTRRAADIASRVSEIGRSVEM